MTGSSKPECDPIQVLLDLLGPTTVYSWRRAPDATCRLVTTTLVSPADHSIPDVACGGVLVYTGTANELLRQFEEEDLLQRGFATVVTKTNDTSSFSIPPWNQVSWILLRPESSLGRAYVSIWSLLCQEAERSASTVSPSSRLFEIANRLASILGGAVAIENIERHVIAYSTVSDQATDPLRRAGILARKVPDSSIHDHQYAELYRDDSPRRYPCLVEGEEYPRFAIAIRDGANVLGSIWVLETAGLNTQDASVELRRAAAESREALLNLRNKELLVLQLEGQQLRQLLLDGANNPVELSGRIRRSRTNPTLFHYTLPHEQNGTLRVNELTLAITRRLGSLGFPGTATVIGTDLAVLIENCSTPTAMERCSSAIMEAVAARINYTSRIIYGQYDITQLQSGDAWIELCRAANICSLADMDGEAHNIESVRSYFVLFELSESALRAANHYSSESIATLLRSEETEVAEDRHSLLSYLDHFGDIKAAANGLHVHPNTLRYRLTRLKKQWGVDLTGGPATLSLWLALWARQLAGTSPTSPPL